MEINGSYELMFGKSDLPQFQPMALSMFPVFVNSEVIRETMEKARSSKQWVLAFCIGTKPCFYKFFGSIQAADQDGLPYLVVNSGQHYDERLVYGKDEFNYRDRIACELGIRGDLAVKSAELLTASEQSLQVVDLIRDPLRGRSLSTISPWNNGFSRCVSGNS